MAVELSIELSTLSFLTLVIVLLTLRHYCGKSYNQAPWILYTLLLFSYFICFIPVPLLLCDVQAAISTKAYNPTVHTFWAVIYWSTQALAWFVLPVCKSYLEQGHFSPRKRLYAAISLNVRMYIAMGLVVLILVLWVLVKEGIDNFQALIEIGRAASNAFGLFLSMSFLGYGLVEVPRSWFFWANLERYKMWHEFTANNIWDAAEGSQIDWFDLQEEIKKITREVKEGHELYRFVEAINRTVEEVNADIHASCPNVLSTREGSRRLSHSHSREENEDAEQEFTEVSLVALNGKVKQIAHQLLKTEYEWQHHRKQYYFLEDALKAKADQAPKSLRTRRSHPEWLGPWGHFVDLAEYWYWVSLRAFVLRSIGAMLLLVSLAVLWSEAVTPMNPSWSLVNQVINVMPEGVMMQLVILALLAYITCCSYWTLFHLKLFDMYSLVPHHSNPAHLCWAGYNLTRFILPLCFNFLTIGDLMDRDAATSDISFIRVFGNMPHLGLLGDRFRRWFAPTLLICITLFTACNGFARSLSLCDLKSFVTVDHYTDEEVSEGKEILRTARKKDKSEREMEEALSSDDEDQL
uniref:LMBR1 domain-containing protein 2 homolog n=1 Tax=Eutreptiella gymnastica TaxID=73025 RepID=A0A7S1I8H4_9EUGL